MRILRWRLAVVLCLSMVAAVVAVAVGPAGPVAAAVGPSRPIMIRGATWYVLDGLSPAPATWTFDFGAPGDMPVAGDWNGDGLKTPGVVRGNTWYLRNSLSAGPADLTFTFGLPSDAVIVGDWDGNGTDTPGVVSGRNWQLRNSNSGGGADISFVWGALYDVPIAGDWDGNGTDTPGAVRGAARYLRNSLSGGTADIAYSFGLATDRPVVGDWDGNGTVTTGVVRAGRWYLRNSNSAGPSDAAFAYGTATDLPLTTSSAFVRDRGARPLTAARTGNHLSVLPTTAKVVALTFDAGANNAGVAKILSTLATARVAEATFFMTGAFARTYPNDARTIGLRYPMGNHTDTHPDLTTLTDAQVTAQLQTAQSTLANATRYDPRPIFRFPFGATNTRTLQLVNAAGYTSFWWTVDTLGWQGTSGGQSVSTVVNRVLNTLRPGQIILLHCGAHPTDGSTLDADALPTIIAQLRARGYTFVTLVPYL
jgi:peptidoglycan/xylan/chitin deacetylase (PgdA/CDA1 family)